MSKISGRALALAAGGIVLLAVLGFMVWRGSADASDTTADTRSSVEATSSPTQDATSSAEATVVSDPEATTSEQGEDSTSVQSEGSKNTAVASSAEPADEDKRLSELGEIPDDTLAAISSETPLSMTSFRIVFEPYGTTSVGSDDAVVVYVVSVESPEIKNDSSLDLEGHNLLLRLQGATVDRGGTYEGVVRLRTTDDKTEFVLEYAQRR